MANLGIVYSTTQGPDMYEPESIEGAFMLLTLIIPFLATLMIGAFIADRMDEQ